jgi:hypothetical protein
MADNNDGETPTADRKHEAAQGGSADWLASGHRHWLAAPNLTSWGGGTVLICWSSAALDLIRLIM